MNVLTVDPGTPFGWSVWSGRQLTFRGTCKQDYPEWKHRSAQAADQLRKVIRDHVPHKVVIEMPVYMPGHAAAAGGNLVKLCFTVGRMLQICTEEHVLVVAVSPGEWKGQMGDKAVRYRARSVLGAIVDDIPIHELDAVCIGLHIHGRWPRG